MAEKRGLKKKENEFNPEVRLFCCERSGYPALEMAANLNLIRPDDFEIIKVSCAGGIESVVLLESFQKIDGVFVLACHKEVCQSLRGNLRAEARINYLKDILSEIGLEKERLKIHFTAPSEGVKLSGVLNEGINELKVLGPNSGRERT